MKTEFKNIKLLIKNVNNLIVEEINKDVGVRGRETFIAISCLIIRRGLGSFVKF